MKFSRVLIAATMLAATSSVLSAQTIEGTRSGIQRTNLVSANPIGLIFEWYNGEYEHAMSSTVSLAVAGSSFGDIETSDDTRYSVLDGIVRYYPSGRALRGFSIGGSVGFVDFSDDFDDDECIGCSDESGTGATIGVRGDYVWILGRDQHFAVAAGIGAKRVLGSDIGLEGLPIARLSIGYAW
jgi:hypothetical protein